MGIRATQSPLEGAHVTRARVGNLTVAPGGSGLLQTDTQGSLWQVSGSVPGPGPLLVSQDFAEYPRPGSSSARAGVSSCLPQGTAPPHAGGERGPPTSPFPYLMKTLIKGFPLSFFVL